MTDLPIGMEGRSSTYGEFYDTDKLGRGIHLSGMEEE